MSDKYLKRIGNSNLPKANLPKVTVPGQGPQKLQKVPTEDEIERIRNEKKRPKQTSKVSVGIYETSIPALKFLGNLAAPQNAPDPVAIRRIIDEKTRPQLEKYIGPSLLPKRGSLSEQATPDEEELARIRREKARPAPAAPVRPPEPKPAPESPPDKPKE
jgi:hypothetical protein